MVTNDHSWKCKFSDLTKFIPASLLQNYLAGHNLLCSVDTVYIKIFNRLMSVNI